MAWSAQFTTALAMQSRNPVYRLLVHGGYGSTGFRLGSTPPGRALTIASAPGYAPPSASGSALLLIGQRIRVQGTRVGPITWRVSIGQWAVELVGDISTFRKHCPRGAICSLEMGFVGWDVSKFQRIAVGRFQACTSTGLERGVQHDMVLVTPTLLQSVNFQYLHVLISYRTPRVRGGFFSPSLEHACWD